MKTSNYIIISYSIILFVGIFVLFTAAKIHSLNESKSIWQEKELPPFSVVVAESEALLNVESEKKTKIGLLIHKGDTCIYPSYEIRNDTLFVHSYPVNVKQPSVFVFGTGIKTVQGKQYSTIWLRKFWGDTLVLKLNEVRFQFIPDSFNLKKLSCLIYANRSNVEITGVNFDKLDVNLNYTQMNTNSLSVSKFSGVLKDHSILSISDLKRINIDSDSTSTFVLKN